MSKKVSQQTNFTGQVKLLIDKIYGSSTLQDSLLERAISFYQYQKSLATVPTSLKNSGALTEEELNAQRIERNIGLYDICREIIQLCEAENFEECNRKSAQLLGTIQLISPTEGERVSLSNEKSKPLYKAVLSLRLLDWLCINKEINDPFILQYVEHISAEQYREFAYVDPIGYQRFVEQVKIPLIIAVLLQDIGHYYPDAQIIISGNDGREDPFRVLDAETRKQLLQINYRETIHYLIQGIGAANYVGSSRIERESFNKDEKSKLGFIQRLIKQSVNAKEGLGDLLKIPQIYTSIILSTKANYNYKLLPQVYKVLNKSAERGYCSQEVVDGLYQITGMFPQGYGVVYMPIDDFGAYQDCYEYAIVNQLYPENPQEPSCRLATRGLNFVSFGQNIVVQKKCNLYFAETAKKLSSISSERLNEILELLVSNYQERQALDLLPRCWHSGEYFSVKDNQKLWNKSA